MATTTNYGWTTPDDTALVKDGAAAIRTLGSSVDTTTKNLNPSTTLGDIEYRSSTANTNTRLGIGSSGQVLTVSGGVPAWGSASSMTLLTTHSLSGSTSTISGISGSYTRLFGLVYGVTNSVANSSYLIQPNGVASGVQFWTSDAIGTTATPVFALVDWYLAVYATDRTKDTNAWSFTIDNYTSTTNWKPFQMSGAYEQASTKDSMSGGGAIRTNSAITSLDFVVGSGTFSTGTVLLYGVK